APGPGTPSSSATTTTAPAVCARGLTRAYGRGDAQVHALRGVDVDFASGAVTTIKAPSGTGKSTHRHRLSGLHARTP
ncbi:ABC transporter ATP-binding protein, partial [Micrococcus sp. SIMBA_131]